MMPEVCKDTKIEPNLTPQFGEELRGRTSNNSNKASVDIKTRGFWEQGQQTFFDLWVFDPSACRYCSKSPQQCYNMNEQEKKQVCNEIILKIDHSTFKPLAFSINGSMGRECQKFCLSLGQINLERETFRNSNLQFQLIGFEQKLALCC